MIIAVNANFLLKDRLEGVGFFTWEVLQQLVHKHPEHQFHLFFDRSYPLELIFASNVIGHKISPAARHPLLWKYWFDIAIPRQLKQIKADVFLSPGGFCSLITKVPQCMVIHDLGFLHHPDTYKKSHHLYYKVNTGKFLRKATSIVCLSEYTRKEVLDQYRIKISKITVVYSAVKGIFKPIDDVERQMVKDKYSNGAEFFLYVGAIQQHKNLVNLLKAFSVFKKRLQSGMKLVLAGRMAWKKEEFTTLLKSYKYKEDVILTGYVAEQDLASLVASAYALVNPSLFEGFELSILEAMNCDVPVLTSKGTAMEAINAEAAMYFDPANVNDMAEKLMLIYKDETLRVSLIEKGRVVAAQYSWERTSELMWKALIAAAGKQD